MKVIVAAALVLCVAVQVFAEPITKEEVDDAINRCTNYVMGEIDFGCAFEILKVQKGNEIDISKLKELVNVLKSELSEEKKQKLIEKCADQKGYGLYDCIMYSAV